MAWQLCGTKIELDLRHVTHCHTHTAATLTNTLCFTRTLSLSLSLMHTNKHTLKFDISQLLWGGRRQEAGSIRFALRHRSVAIFASLSLYSLLFTFIPHLSALFPPSPKHTSTTSQAMYVAFPSALPPSRNAFRKSAKKQMKMENETHI